MVEDEQSSNYRFRRLSRIILVIVTAIFLLLVIGWHILRSDHKFVIRKVQETALSYFDIHLQLEGYRLEWASPYPLIRFQLRGLSIASKRNPKIETLRINRAMSEFNPWDLITGDFQAHPFKLDSAWVHLYNDSLQQQEYEKLERPRGGQGVSFELSELPAISANYLDFHREDNYRHKWQWVKFSRLQMEPRPNEKDEWWLYVKTDSHFEGLVFKEADGGFLMDTPARMEMEFAVTDDGHTLQWENSKLTVGRNTFNLRGQYHWADTNQIQLQISTDGIMVDEALPLLSDKLNTTLGGIQVDQPVRTDFSLFNLIVPDRKEAIEVEFLTRDATIRYQGTDLTSAAVSGTFSNDCDQDGLGDPVTSCINLHQVDGDIFGVLPTQLQGVINNMEDPQVEAAGRMDIDLPRLNVLLAEKNKATFASGQAIVNFRYDGSLLSAIDAPFEDRNVRVEGDAIFNEITLATADRSISSPSLSGYLSFDQRQTLLEDIDLKWMGANIQLSGQISNLPEFFFYDDQTLISNLGLHFDQLDLNRFSRTGTSQSTGKKSPAPDGQRMEEIARQLANNVNGSMHLRIDKLIYDTLYLTDLTTRFRLFTLRREDYADSSMVRMDSLRANFMGTAPIFASLKVSREATPEVEAIVELPIAVRAANQFLPPEMKITAGRARADLVARVPLRSIFEQQQLPNDLRYEGNIVLTGIELAKSDWSEQVRSISGPIRFDSEQLLLEDILFDYRGEPFTLTGTIRDYAPFIRAADQKATIDLRMNGRSLDLRKGSSANASTTKGSSKMLSPPELFRSLEKIYDYGTGAVHLDLNQVLTDQRTIQPFQVTGRILPDAAGPDQYQFRVDSFNLGLEANNYFKGSAVIEHPDEPVITARVDARLDFHQLGQLLPSKYIEMRSGEFLMDLQYQSPLYDTLNAKNYLLEANIDGNAQLVNGELFYNYRDFSFKNLTGDFHFDQKALYIKKLALEVNGNQLVASGRSNEFFSFFVLPDQQAHIALDVRSPRFDFGGFTAPHGLGKDTLRTLRKASKLLAPQITGVQTPDTTNTLKQTVGYIDQLLDRGTVEMSTDFQEVIYENFSAHRVGGRISLAPDSVQLHNLQMDVADGTFSIAGLISNIVRHEPKMEVSIEMDENNVREIFRQFDNFGQKELGYKNLEGLISANLDIQADVNSNYSILPESISGDMKVKLAGGELVDLKLFDKLSGFLFRKRKMEHVILDTLELNAHIRGSDVYVDNFYLHSSPFDFKAIGRYSLGADKNTRVLFTLPIGNLFNRHVSLEEMQEGDSKRFHLINILIEARYKKGKMRFIWKPFVISRKKYQPEE